MQGVSLRATPLIAVTRLAEARTRTGPNGRSRIVDITPAGSVYLITARKESYAPAGVIVGFDRFDEVPSRTLTLRKGITVRGRALCLDGKPATGWGMYAMPDWWIRGFYPERAEIDEDGFFTFHHIVPGRYNLQVSIPAGGGGGVGFRVLTANLPPAEGRVNVTIPRASPQSSVSISGTITFLGGRPRPSVEASARSAGNELYSTWVLPRPGDRPDKVTFEIGPLPPGLYTVQFSSPQIERKVLRGIRAPVKGLNVEIAHTGRPMLRGEVVEAGTGRPVTWFQARVRQIGESGYGQDSEWKTFKNDKGRFQIETIGQGVFDVQVAAPDFAWALSREIDTATDKAAVPIKLNVAEILRGPVVDKAAVRIELNAGVTLRGRVVNEAGQPVSGAKVIPLSWGGGTRSRTLKRFVSEDEFVTTVDGVYTIEHLAPGTESLKVRHPDYCFTIVKGIEVAAGRVTDGPTITLTRGGTVRGRVYDVDGKPAPNVMLYFQDEMGPGDLETGRFATVLTDADGRYEVQHLPEQFCYVEHDYRRPLLGVVRRGVLVKNGQTRTIDLGGVPVISGRLVVNGEPLVGARMLLSGADRHFSVFSAFGYTQADGSFTFRGVPPGVRHIYYDLGGTRSSFVTARTLRIADRDIDLGVVSVTTGTVTVQLEAADGDEVPPDVRLFAEVHREDLVGWRRRPPQGSHGTDRAVRVRECAAR